MITGMVLATGAADPERGWGNLLGLLVGVVGAFAIWRFDKYRQQKRGGADDPSPTPPPAPLSHETPQVARVSSQKSHAEPGETGEEWYGRIVRRGGRIVRVAKHVVRTGDSPSEDDEEWAGEIEAYDPPDEPEIDLPLDDGEDEDEEEIEPVRAARPMRETREQYARRCAQEGIPKSRIVAGLIEHYGVSRPTAYRVAGEAAARSGRPAA